jgi:hypothetical protein
MLKNIFINKNLNTRLVLLQKTINNICDKYVLTVSNFYTPKPDSFADLPPGHTVKEGEFKFESFFIFYW